MWGAQQGFNQWALQPAMFNDVPHEQIDWAALAKQWIQMQQAPSTTDAPPTAIPPNVPSQMVTQPAPPPPPPPPGHGNMMPEEFIPEMPVNTPLLKTPIAPGAVPEHFQPERHFDADPAAFVPKNVNNSYWNKPQWEGGGPGDNDGRMWPPPPVEPSLLGGKETYDYGHMHDNPPLAMQSIDYNHMSDFNYGPVYGPPPETQYDQYWSQVNAAPPITPMFLKKERSSTSNSSHRNEEDTSQLDAAKRKQLPAWIREGLEKMEQERIKKIEKDKAAKEKAEKLAMEKLKSEDSKNDVDPAFVKSKFDSDSESESEDIDTKPTAPKQSPPRSPSPIDVRTEEEKRQEYMLNVRHLLTHILLTVTNDEMRAVAEEVLKKERLKARQLASTASLSTVATGLRGLANYGTESEASDVEEDKEDTDSEEELYRRIREKKKLFAVKSKKILAEIERKELEEQNEALKAKNDTVKSIPVEKAEPEAEIVELENVAPEEDEVPVVEISSEVSDAAPNETPKSDETPDEAQCETTENNNRSKETKYPDEEQQSSHSSSNSSESGGESSKRRKKKPSKDGDERRSSKKEKDKSPSKKHRRRSQSSESDSSNMHHKSRSSDDKYRRSSSSKKKKYKRSESSSSSSSSDTKRRYSSKSETSHNHHRNRRSHSYEDRKRRRSLSPRNYRSSRDYHRSKDFHSHRSKHEKRDKYDHRRSPSPHRRSSKLPKSYRSSRTPSSERESRKSKKSRTR